MPAPRWPLETERLRLRPFGPDDLEALFAIQADESVARWLYNDPRTLEETRELLVRKIGGAALHGEGEWLSAAAVLRTTGELVGDVSLHWASEAHGQGELGFVVHPEHQGRGYATEASRPLLDFAFASGYLLVGWGARIHRDALT